MATGALPPHLAAALRRLAGATSVRGIFSVESEAGGAAGAALRAEVAGVVVDTRTWRVLAAGPPPLSREPTRATDVALAAGLYDVVAVDDGTVVTLYAYLDAGGALRWGLATARGYDVATLYWAGPRTYAENLLEAARISAPEFAARLTVRDGGLAHVALDPAFCYSVGFRCADFHPYAGDSRRTIWAVGVAAVGAATVRGGQLSLARFAGAAPPGVTGQRLIELGAGGPPTVAGLRARVADSLARARADPTAPGEYGFVLRARPAVAPPGLRDVLVESPLLARIRQLVYEPAPGARGAATPETRLELAAWRAFLAGGEMRADFAALFPRLGADFAAYATFVTDVVAAAKLIVRWNRYAPLRRADDPNPADSPAGRAAVALLAALEQNEPGLSMFAEDAEGVAADYANCPDRAPDFLAARRAMTTAMTQ
jgi:hypothetical protein